MAQSNFTSPPSSHRGSVDFAVISEAYEIVKNNLGPYIVIALLGIVASTAISTIISLPQTLAQMRNPPPQTGDPMQQIIEQMTQQYTIGLPFTILNGIVSTGIIALMSVAIANMTIKAVQGKRIEVTDGFEAMKFFVPAFFVGIISWFLGQLGLLACLVGTLIIGGLLIPAYPIIVHERLGAIDAIKRSFNLMSNHVLMAAVFFLVQGLLSAVGALACCVGILFTIPMATACSTLIYRDVSGVSFSGEPTSATVYPREGGGNMPGYTGTTDPQPQTDPEAPRSPEDPSTPPSDPNQ